MTKSLYLREKNYNHKQIFLEFSKILKNLYLHYSPNRDQVVPLLLRNSSVGAVEYWFHESFLTQRFAYSLNYAILLPITVERELNKLIYIYLQNIFEIIIQTSFFSLTMLF